MMRRPISEIPPTSFDQTDVSAGAPPDYLRRRRIGWIVLGSVIGVCGLIGAAAAFSAVGSAPEPTAGGGVAAQPLADEAPSREERRVAAEEPESVESVEAPPPPAPSVLAEAPDEKELQPHHPEEAEKPPSPKKVEATANKKDEPESPKPKTDEPAATSGIIRDSPF